MKIVVRLSSLTALLLAICSGGALFWVSQQVQQAEREQYELKQVIDREQEAIRVLDAEWDYLNRPDRLESLAENYLKMEQGRGDDLLRNVNAIPEPATLPQSDRPVFAATGPAPQAVALPPKRRAEPVVPIDAQERSFGRLMQSFAPAEPGQDAP